MFDFIEAVNMSYTIILLKAKCLLLGKITFKLLEQCSYMWTLPTHYSNVNNQDNYIIAIQR